MFNIYSLDSTYHPTEPFNTNTPKTPTNPTFLPLTPILTTTVYPNSAESDMQFSRRLNVFSAYAKNQPA